MISNFKLTVKNKIINRKAVKVRKEIVEVFQAKKNKKQKIVLQHKI